MVIVSLFLFIPTRSTESQPGKDKKKGHQNTVPGARSSPRMKASQMDAYRRRRANSPRFPYFNGRPSLNKKHHKGVSYRPYDAQSHKNISEIVERTSDVFSIASTKPSRQARFQ